MYEYEEVEFLRPDGDIEQKSVNWCKTNGFFQVGPGLWSGPWHPAYIEKKNVSNEQRNNTKPKQSQPGKMSIDNRIGTRTCASCCEQKEASDFSKNQWKKIPVGVSRCKICVQCHQQKLKKTQQTFGGFFAEQQKQGRPNNCPQCNQQLNDISECFQEDCCLKFCSSGCRQTHLESQARKRLSDPMIGIAHPCGHELAFGMNECKKFGPPKIEILTLPSGEDCKVEEWSNKVAEKEPSTMGYFEITRYFVDGKNVDNHYTSYKDTCPMSGSCEGKVLDSKFEPNGKNDEESKRHQALKAQADYELSRKLHDFLHDRFRRNKCLPLLKPLLEDTNFSFHKVLSDHNMFVSVTDWVSFGDLKDTKCCKPQHFEVSGTITGHINTVRQFIPGKYFCTIIYPFGSEGYPYTFFHHEAICPSKLMRRILCLTDCSRPYYPRSMANHISRYDWCHWCNWGDEFSESDTEDSEEEEVNCSDLEEDVYCEASFHHPSQKRLFKYQSYLFFTPTENSPNIKQCIKKDQTITSHCTDIMIAVSSTDCIKEKIGLTTQKNEELDHTPLPPPPQPAKVSDADAGPASGPAISLAVDTAETTEEWCFGQVFQDISTEKYFALVLDGEVDGLYDGVPPMMVDEFPGAFTSITETNMRFDLTQFLKEGVTSPLHQDRKRKQMHSLMITQTL